VVYEGRRRGQIEGYLHYEVDSSHGPFRLAMTLGEFVAATPAAHAGLVAYLGSLADQVNEIHYAAPADGAWLAVLKTAQNLRPGAEIGVYSDTGGIANGAMLRVTDVRAALEGFPVAAARGEVELEVEDAILPQNARTWRVSARDGRLHVTAAAAGGRGRRPPRLTVPSDALGPIVAGTLSPLRAAETGLVESAGGAETIEHWFRGRPAFLYQLNGF
jgi:predicted acetyltransferase